jgi:spore germination protein GerM
VRTVTGRRFPLVALVAAVATLAGCGVPLDDQPRTVGDARRPLRSGTPNRDGEGTAVERLCFVRDNSRLVRVSRRLPQPRTPAQKLTDLLAGPGTADAAGGLTSALAATTELTLKVQAARATVDIGTDPAAKSLDVLAFGQIVCTLTSQGQVGTVTFTSGGGALGVPGGDGRLSTGPLTIADYASLLDD